MASEHFRLLPEVRDTLAAHRPVVMATGGIGGVHRGAEKGFDVSADLRELARVAVVSAGAKSIVDPGLTLEYLETHGVPMLGLGSDRFPAFFIRDSGFEVDDRVDSEAQLAAILKAQWDLGLAAGMVVANPIAEDHEVDPEFLDEATRQVLTEARERGVSGQELTPFLLSRIEALSCGESLKANVELVLSSAPVGARLAREVEADTDGYA